MKDISKSEKELLETMIRNEFDRIQMPYDNTRYFQLIELAEKLYLRHEFVAQLKSDLDIY